MFAISRQELEQSFFPNTVEAESVMQSGLQLNQIANISLPCPSNIDIEGLELTLPGINASNIHEMHSLPSWHYFT